MTRASGQPGPLEQLLAARGARIVAAPAIDLVEPRDWGPVDEALKLRRTYHVIVFTSAHAVERFCLRARASGAALTGLPARILAIGPATAEALARHGLPADALPGEARAEGLADLLEGMPLAGQRVLLPRAEVARELLPEMLKARGATVDIVPVYRTVGVPLSAEVKQLLVSRAADLVVFASGSAVTQFLSEVGGPQGLRGAAVAALGPVTAQAARDLGLSPALTGTPSDPAGMADQIEQFYAQSTGPRSRPDSSSRGSAPR